MRERNERENCEREGERVKESERNVGERGAEKGGRVKGISETDRFVIHDCKLLISLMTFF